MKVSSAPVIVVVIVCIAVGVWFYATPKGPNTQITITDDPPIAIWQGGNIHLASVENFHGRNETHYKVRWVSGTDIVDMSTIWPEKPTVRVLANGKLGMVVGKPGDYNLQVYDTPRGPSTARQISKRMEAEDELNKLR